MYKEIVQKIIDLLKADAALSEPAKVKKYYFGIPPGGEGRLPVGQRPLGGGSRRNRDSPEGAVPDGF
ncbi:hypothetical protein [Candidatus Hecatella orcuttiae]|jgi:hypothetical protein|uniref:hypothetical protein n=1 Tax=Candidatus Hecatella orcuttiae TaxID=1935119 RepID=UPI002867C5AA|nr:hypothetical protein [Candidatus Hecatella orcuttiae]